ncbi:glycosyltransferase [Algoriphagus formosus]|uniref:glycosyltransferase n=1 Tax=Algoriphagus formosus TaxID=2007308 RepID=UPI000C284335|nr:glycosyltransferase [Algoriphagus formosus]
MAKGIYLITEPACLNPFSGAFQHISVGYKQLSVSYDMTAYLNHQSINLSNYKTNEFPQKKGENIISIKKRGVLYGTVKDLQLIIQYVLNIAILYKVLKGKDVNFIYERTAYINFSGLIVAKFLGIPHFYEANGIQYKGKEKYYKSLLSPIIKRLEKWMYKNSTHVFFVGSYGLYWNLKSKNWSNIENGVESKFLEFFKEKKKKILKPLNLCFIARLMAHQRPDLLIEALRNVKDHEDIVLHLIGSGLESIKEKLKDKIKVVNHGFQNREAIKHILHDMHVGIIAGSPEYQSTMKIFDYGVAKCAVIAPDIINLKNWFEQEVLFFEKNNSYALALEIDILLENPKIIKEYGESLYEKIENNFTWDKNYYDVITIISRSIE